MISKLFSRTKKKACFPLFSLVYIFTNSLFTCEQKGILKVLLAKIKDQKVPKNFWLENPFLKCKTNQKQFLFSFICFFTNSLFTGKQKNKQKLLMAQINLFEVSNNFLTSKLFLKTRKRLVFLYFLLFTFSLIPCLLVKL